MMRGSARLTDFLGGRDSRALPRRILAAGTGLAVLYLVLITGQRALEAYRINQEVDAVRRDIEALRTRNIELQAELSGGRLDEDIERIARDELGMVRPGDQPVVLVWPDGSTRRGTESPEPKPATEPSWRTWLRLFFD
jgi:cell division protein FtsB